MMKTPESSIDRLLEMARDAASEPVGSMAPQLQTRVLAHWQTAGSQPESLGWLNLLFGRAVACAALLMLASIIWSYTAGDLQAEDDLALANLELRVDALP